MDVVTTGAVWMLLQELCGCYYKSCVDVVTIKCGWIVWLLQETCVVVAGTE